MKANNQHIISLLKAQDQQAISFLYDQYASALYGIILKIVHTEEVAQDVLQESFIKAWKNGSRYDSSKGTLFTWLLNIARNTAIDKTRSASFRQNGKIQGLDASVYNNIKLSHQQNPDHIGLKAIVGNLEDKYRVIIDLVYFKGYTQQEVGKYLGIPLGTVKSRVRIALRELRHVFEQNQVGNLLLMLFLIHW